MLRSTSLTFLTKLLSALGNFIIIIFLSRWLGDAGKGKCSIYLLVISTSLVVSELICGATISFLMRKYSHRQLLIIFYVWSILAAFITSLFFYFLGKLSLTETYWIFILNWLNAALAIHQQVALGKQKILIFNLLNLLQTFFSTIAVFLLFKFNDKVPELYLYALCISWLPLVVAGFTKVYFFADDNPFTSWSKVIKKGFKSGLSNQTATFIQLINSRIAYLLLPLADAGVYSNAISICEASLIINYSIGTVQYSRILSLHSENEKFWKHNSIKQISTTEDSLKLNGILMFFTLGIIALIPGYFYSFLFGTKFTGVKEVLLILLPGVFFYSFYIITTYYFSGVGKFILNSVPTFFGLIVTILGYLLIKVLKLDTNLISVSLITLVSYLTIYIVGYVQFNKNKIALYNL